MDTCSGLPQAAAGCRQRQRTKQAAERRQGAQATRRQFRQSHLHPSDPQRSAPSHWGTRSARWRRDGLQRRGHARPMGGQHQGRLAAEGRDASLLQASPVGGALSRRVAAVRPLDRLPPDYTAPIAAHAAAHAAGRPANCRSPPPPLPAPTCCSLTALTPLSAALEPSGASSWPLRHPAPAPLAWQLRCTLLRLPRRPRRSQR